MIDSPAADDRSLSVAEREMVEQTRAPTVGTLDKSALQALGKRLREARDRSRRIASQQQREMSGKADPRGAVPAQDNAGSEAKTTVLVAALKSVTAALRKVNRPTITQVLQAALDKKNATPSRHPATDQTAAKKVPAKASKAPTVRMDPRETGRVSQRTKVAQAKRDGR